MRIIIRGVPTRKAYIAYLKRHLPNAEWCMDQKQDAMDTFLRALEMAGDEPCIHMEDDAILCRGFEEKVKAVIAERPHDLINFFSRRKDDLDKGSRYDYRFSYNICFYLPEFYSADILRYYEKWEDKGQHPTGYDLMMDDWLRERSERHWIHVPSLVDHWEGKSSIDRRRNSKRQSYTFSDPV
jgi:hypothetical protein